MKRLAFLGSGPSSLYTIKYVMEKNKEVLVDIIEKLPVPFGLIRYGVAPDHQEVKVVTSQFIEFINENKKRIRFFGNICVDKDVTFKDLHSSYDGVVVCTGAQKDIELTINKDNLNGVYSAREFVNWYNGYPESNKFDFSKIRNVVIIGNGNVALDCARILAKANEVEPSELRKSDISIPALEMIRCGKLESISVVGRRGPVQAAFTIKELRELTRLPEARVCIDPEDMARGLNEASKFEVAASRPKQRILDLIKQCVSSNTGNESSSLPINLKFLLSPVSINGDSGGIKSVTFEMSELQGIESKQNVVGVGKQKTLPCDLLLIAIGYKATPISGLPFNTSLGVFPSIKGRIIGENKVPIHGCYVSG